MVKNGEYFMIKEMKQKGMSITQIAKVLGKGGRVIDQFYRESLRD